jgi:hypothetical protein
MFNRTIPSIPTVGALRRQQRRIDRRRRAALHVVAALQAGAALHKSIGPDGPAWWLAPSGRPVPTAVAAIVLLDLRVAPVGDTLFGDVDARLSQTFRFTSPEHKEHTHV